MFYVEVIISYWCKKETSIRRDPGVWAVVKGTCTYLNKWSKTKTVHPLVFGTFPNPVTYRHWKHDVEFWHWSKYQWCGCWAHGTVHITNTAHPILYEEWNQRRMGLIHAFHAQLQWNTKADRMNNHTDSSKGLYWFK